MDGILVFVLVLSERRIAQSVDNVVDSLIGNLDDLLHSAGHDVEWMWMRVVVQRLVVMAGD